ncbi:glycosyltransferase family 9 protein [Puia dinghuensis]|uniref:Glycosyltransferase family 9 protein n=1 Tax=Puia dinghuensis TaxID=1792502 RepID=A0A8J2UBH1_9BACT|nr:glycosyltransferase family 9 protein [Puia dinghuensis]GGA93558.1 hypothetical protein GCM10011511_16050 [Puia dinghuensis]
MKIYRIVISWGGFGDALIVTAALRSIKKKKRGSKTIVYCPKKLVPLFKGNPYIDLLIPLYFSNKPIFSPAYIFFKRWFKFADLSQYKLEKTTSVSVKKTMADLLGIRLDHDRLDIFLSNKEDNWAKSFLSRFKGKTVAMHITSEHSINNHWNLDKWNELVKKHPDITFIQLGYGNEEKVVGAVDMRGQTSVRQAMALVKHADSFVGVESFFGHVTNAFDKKGVVLFTDSTPTVWGHRNNINLYKNLECSPCYVTLSGYKCPYHQECKRHSVEEVSISLIQQMTK